MTRVVVIGAGFTGLAAAYELVRQGVEVTVLEREERPGGLAAGFALAQGELERFYHHWFLSDEHVLELIRELGLADRIAVRATRSGLFYANRAYRLSSPSDLLRFDALSWFDRTRLGWLGVRARLLRDWRALEGRTAIEWLRSVAGERVLQVVWEPLLRNKFGPHYEEVSAVWMWNKLRLRGGSRRRGSEELAYFRGGFGALAERLRRSIEERGGEVRLGCAAYGLMMQGSRVSGVRTLRDRVSAEAVIATPALPIIADWLPSEAGSYAERLRAIQYLGNVCLILLLDRSLSDSYWLSVNDPEFPFVAVIEHTNFESVRSYGGCHVVYLSRYLPVDHPDYNRDLAALLDTWLPHLQRMFPDFQRHWILDAYRWSARYAQPIVERGYGSKIPPHRSPLEGLYIASMAQIYPEDRGTNYAVRDGRRVGRMVAADLTQPEK